MRGGNPRRKRGRGAARAHIQFYSDNEFAIEDIRHQLIGTPCLGHTAIVNATEIHREKIDLRPKGNAAWTRRRPLVKIGHLY